MSWDMWDMGTVSLEMEFDEVPCKGRPRFDSRTGRTYTPAKTQEFEKAIKKAWVEKHGYRRGQFAGPVSIVVHVSKPLFKSNPKHFVGRSDLSKPDWDNVGKLFCDALNGVAFKDDSQIIVGTVMKLPRVEHGKKTKVAVYVTYWREIEKKGM